MHGLCVVNPSCLCSAVASREWGNQTAILPKIIDIESEHEKHENETKEYILIGTLWKDMTLRGSVSPKQ
jgi:hypothetical protein